MVAVALVPLGDTLTVLRHGGTKAAAFGIHFATAAVVLLGAALLFAVWNDSPAHAARVTCSPSAGTW